MARKRGLFSTGTASSVGAGLGGIFSGIQAADAMKTSAAQRANLATQAALEQDKLKIDAAKANQGSDVLNTITGTHTMAPGAGISFDDNGHVIIGSNPGPKTIKPINPSAGNGGGRGSVQQSSFADSDGTPLLFNRDTKSYIRSDTQMPPVGKPVPIKGNSEAVTNASRTAEILPRVDQLFSALKEKNPVSQRLSLVPGISGVFYPEIKQLKSEVEQVGFTFGGKNYTGHERQIIMDALIPGPLDNQASLDAKQSALHGYMSGQVDMAGMANLLGPGGAQIKALIDKNAPSPTGGSSGSPAALPDQPMVFASEAEYNNAEQAGRLRKGQKVVVGGVPGTAQ